MKNRSNRTNNGYIGAYEATNIDDGVISGNKNYMMALRDCPVTEDFYQGYGISGGPNYTRPSQWVELPGVTGGNIIVGAYAVYNTDSNFASFTISTSSGNYLVNWGDGTTGSIASGSAAYKQYTTASYAGLTSSVFRNYKTALITITPVTSGANFTNITLTTKHNQSGLASYYSNGWLDLRISAPACTTALFSNYNFSNQNRSSKLEQIEWIGEAPISSLQMLGLTSLQKIVSFPSCRNVTNWTNMFHSCHMLQEIPKNMDFSNATGGFNYVFYNCFMLRKLPPLNTRNVTTMVGTFISCINLRRIPYLDTSNVTNMDSCFYSCNVLEYVPYLDTRKVTNINYLFFANRSLKQLQPELLGASFTSCVGTFSSCQHLLSVPRLNTQNVTTMNSMFASSVSLKTVPQYNFSSCTDVRSMFSTCYSLEYVPDMNTPAGLTAVSALFNDCRNLQYAPGISMGTVTDINLMFYRNWNLHTIPAYNFSAVTNTTNAFGENFSLASCGITGFSQTVDFTNASMGATALNALYSSLGTVTAKTITVTGNWGTATDNTAIATGKGWTVTG
jgi:hypothetical protein